MNRTRWNIVLMIFVVVVLAANLTLRGNPTSRNIEVMPEMLVSVPYDSFTENPIFDDGLTMRPLVEGTVLYKDTPLHYAATPEDAIRAGLELVNPIVPDEAVLVRGQAVFMTYCEVCHGPEGKGDGPVAKRGYPTPPSILEAQAKSRTMGDGQIFHMITYGGENMPSYAAQLLPEDRWRSVLWVRELQKKVDGAEGAAPEPTDGLPTEVVGEEDATGAEAAIEVESEDADPPPTEGDTETGENE